MTTSAENRPGQEDGPPSRRKALAALVRAVREDDDKEVEAAGLTISRSRRIFAPLAFGVAAFVMLFHVVRDLLNGEERLLH